MDRILHNGKVYRGLELEMVSAIGIKDSKIVMLGSDDFVLESKTEQTQCIDLKGRAVFAGFNDSHMHLLNYGYTRTMVRLTGARSIEDLQERARDFIEQNDFEEEEWILGRGWNQDYFSSKVFPTRYDLDAISTDHPLLFTRACGHIFVVNSKALEIAGIDSSTPQVEGGYFDVDEQGEPLGIFRENAQELILRKVRPPSIEQMKSMMRRAFYDLNKEGITSVGSDDFGAMPDHNYRKVIRAYKELLSEGDMSVRVYQQCLLPQKTMLLDFYDEGYCTGKGCDFFKIGPLKLLIDGALGARTALLREPYCDDPSTRGIATATQEELNDLILTAHQNDCQVAIHGIGDGGMDMAFTAIENALKLYHREDHRHGIIHAQITDEPLMKKFQDLKVLAYIQPIFLDYDWKIVNSRVGSARESTSYDWKGMYDRGIHASMGSDAPVDTFSVMAGIYEAVTRKDLNGQPAEGWMMDKAVSVEQAILGYTIEGAYASFEEDIKGTIDINKLADLVVLSEDPLRIDKNRIKDIKVDMTIVGGKVVYER